MKIIMVVTITIFSVPMKVFSQVLMSSRITLTIYAGYTLPIYPDIFNRVFASE